MPHKATLSRKGRVIANDVSVWLLYGAGRPADDRPNWASLELPPGIDLGTSTHVLALADGRTWFVWFEAKEHAPEQGGLVKWLFKVGHQAVGDQPNGDSGPGGRS